MALLLKLMKYLVFNNKTDQVLKAKVSLLCFPTALPLYITNHLDVN